MKNLANLLVIDGGTVKTEEEGVVTGMGIVFGSETEPDQSSMRDFFTADSFIMKRNSFTVPLYYEHGLGPINDQIGEATLTKTEHGWEAYALIDVEDEIGRRVYEAVKERPHGFSTGALKHLVKRETKSNNTNFLKKWVVGEISLTERPAERRAVVEAVKSIDGELVRESAWADETPVKFTFLDEGGAPIAEAAEATPEIIELARSLEVKYQNGSVVYSLYHYDETQEKGTEVTIYQWGGIEDLVARMQDMLNTAAMAIKNPESEQEDPSTAMEPGDEMEDEPMMMDQSKQLELQITRIVKQVVGTAEQSAPEVSELNDRLKQQEEELADLRKQLSTRDEALTTANEKIAQLEILAGAKETIDNFKKGK